jgi:hypothetical protein
MQATVVLLMALSGLGCQNKPSTVVDTPPALPSASAGSSYPLMREAGPSPYAAHASALYTPYHPLEGPNGFWDSMRDTCYSFFHGRSPGVPSPREIEASVYQYDAGY